MARQDSRHVHCCRGFGQIRLLFALSAASHLQLLEVEVFFWRSYSGFAITHGLQTTKMVEDDRIELSTLRCKRSVFPLALIPQKKRGLSFASTLTTRLFLTIPPRSMVYIPLDLMFSHSDTHTDKLFHCRDVFCFLFLTVRCNIEGHTQSLAGVVGIEPTTE